ncbi:MAG TPA: hypothetical protein VGI10_10115 [Polyangiaceae bacterium]|jgi:hypothetical protein
MSADAIEFQCPGCARPCRVSIAQKAVQHSDPICAVWVAHKGDREGKKMQDFLGLALMQAKGNMILGEAGATETERAPSDEKAKADILEQLYEGMKRL